MRGRSGRALALVLALAGGSADGQPVLSVYEVGDAPVPTTVPRLGGGPPVALGPSRLDVEADELLTVGLEGSGGEATLSLWLGDEAASAYAAITEAAVGRDLAFVVDGRAVAVQTVATRVDNGNVVLPGLPAAEASAVAARLRGATPGPLPASDAPAAVEPEPLPPAERLPISPLDLPGAAGTAEPSVPSPEPAYDEAGLPPAGAPSGGGARPPSTPVTRPSGDGAAAEAALAFVEAIRQRDWPSAARALHPDALARLRPDALALLRVERGAVVVAEAGGAQALDARALLGRRVRGDLDGLSDEDLGVLYLAALDALGVWGDPGPPRRVVGQVPAEGGALHVVLAPAGSAPVGGVSDVTVLTVRPDAAGRWRPLLTHARGF